MREALLWEGFREVKPEDKMPHMIYDSVAEFVGLA